MSRTVAPQKSNIATKNDGYILKESPFPDHRFGVSMLVFGDVHEFRVPYELTKSS